MPTPLVENLHINDIKKVVCDSAEIGVDDDKEEDDVGSKIENVDVNYWNSYWHRFFNGENGVHGLYTNYTVILMSSVMLIVVTYLSLQNHDVSDSSLKIYSYYVYLLTFITIFFLWLLIRAIWMSVDIERFTESRVFMAINVVLDPELVHLCAAVSNLMFCAYIPSLQESSNLQYVSIFGLGKIPSVDFQVILKTNLVLIIWAANNLCSRICVFYFLTGLLMNLNGQVVKFLTLYRLIRKLNANWNCLKPSINAFQAEAEIMKNHTLPSGVERKNSETQSLSPEFLTKSNEGKSVRGLPRPIKTFKEKTPQKENITNVPDYTPSILLKKTITDTSKNAVSNLLALEYVRQFPCSLYRDGVQIKFNHQSECRHFGRVLFDDFITFLKLVVPDQDNKSRCDIGVTVLSRLQRWSEYMDPSMIPSPTFGLFDVKVQKDFENQINHLHNDVKRSKSMSISASRHLEKQSSESTICINVDNPLKMPSGKVKSNDLLEQLRSKSLYEGKKKIPKVSVAALFRRFIQTHLDKTRSESYTDSKKFQKANLQNILLEGQKLQRKPHGVENENKDTDMKGLDMFEALSTTNDTTPQIFHSFLEFFLDKDIDVFMSYADVGGRGFLTRDDFVNVFLQLVRTRKQLLGLLASQEVIRTIVSRFISTVLLFLSVLLLLCVTGVSPETIFVSGAAVFLSCTVILSFFYTGLVHAIVYVCILNPYNVGDRIVTNGVLRTVKNVHTYFTEFYTVHGKIEIINHSTLFETPLTNESRAPNAGILIQMLVDFDTPNSKIFALNFRLENFIQTHHEYVKNSFFFFIDEIVVGNYKKISYFATAVDSWGDYISAYYQRGLLYRFIVNQCEKLKIKYHLPHKPLMNVPT